MSSLIMVMSVLLGVKNKKGAVGALVVCTGRGELQSRMSCYGRNEPRRIE